MEEIVFGLISFSGEAKSLLMESISEAKTGNFDQAEKKVQQADEKLEKAHKMQTDLIQKEAVGDKVDPSLLLIHAQDHLMNAILLKKMAKEFIDLYKEVKK